MPANVISVKPGETITVVGINAEPVYPSQGPGFPTNPIAGPGRPPYWGIANDPGYSPPWAQVPPGGQPPLGIWGPTDPRPGYGLPGNQPYPDQGLPPFPNHPIVIPPTEPPPVTPPTDGDDGTWVWAWSPQTGRWVWVKVPGEGESRPKVTPFDRGDFNYIIGTVVLVVAVLAVAYLVS